MISFAKEERIDKQYYVNFILTKDSAQDMLSRAEAFMIQIKLIIQNLKNEEIMELRKAFSKIMTTE